MTTKFIQLFENSGLSRSEFGQAVQLNNIRLTRFFNKDIEMSSIEFKKYKERFDNYLKNKEE